MKLDLSMLSGKLLELATFADEKAGNQNGIYLDNNREISLFMNEAKKAIQKGEITEDDVNKIFGFEKAQSCTAKTADYDTKTAYLENLSHEQRIEVTNKTTEKTNAELSEMAYNLDSMLIENEITGLGAILNRLPEYDLNKLADRYIPMQEKYNKVENEVENWYKNPDTEAGQTPAKLLFEENAEKILGMPYDEYASKYAEEFVAVSKIPPIIRGVSSIAQILLHEKAVAKLNEAEYEVYRKVSALNSTLAVNFNAWENDIRYKANDKTTDMSMDVIMNLDTVSANEYADSESFEMPQNWLVKKNFINAIDSVKGDTSVESPSSDKVMQTKKVLKDGKVIIEKINPDGSRNYYELGGQKISL